MSDEEINMHDPNNELIFYLSNKIGKRNDLNSTSAKEYTRAMVDKIMKEYDVEEKKIIGVAGTRESIERLMITFLNGYMDYWVANDIDFENPLY